MNEPSLHDHRREREEGDDLAREQEDLEAADAFSWWVNAQLYRISQPISPDIGDVISDVISGIYDDKQQCEFAGALFRVYATHGEDPSANRKLIDLLDPYMRSAVRELGD